MRKALKGAMATTAVAALVAAASMGSGFSQASAMMAAQAGTQPAGKLLPVLAPKGSASASPSGSGVGAASNGGQLQSSSSDASSYMQAGSYTFRTQGDPADPTFNQLLGINDSGVIAGYFGSGAVGHPNMGYRVGSGSSSFVNENVSGAAQTQVTGISNRGVTVGFSAPTVLANQPNANTGFYDLGGTLHKVAFPSSNKSAPPVDQLLGVNDSDLAVGFYTDAAGNNHGYEYDINHRSFHSVNVKGAASTTTAAINDYGDVAGFYSISGGATYGFLLTGHGYLTKLAYPGASMTQALGVNAHDEVVGFYQVGTGDTAQTHGFTWTAKGSFKQVDDPSGVGATTVNGVNDSGTLVGFYVDGAGNTDGMIATPNRDTVTVRHLNLAAMPTGSVTLSRDSDGKLEATVSASGLTPGSAHTVEIDAPWYQGPVVRFDSTLTADATGNAHATLKASGYFDHLPSGSRFVILLGTTSGYSSSSSDGSSSDSSNSGNGALAAEPIARSGQLQMPTWQSGNGDGNSSGNSSNNNGSNSNNGDNNNNYGQNSQFKSALSAVDVTTNGVNLGQLTGRATVVYDSAAQTLTVTVNATGLTPGAHAAHIHSGSCQSQGGVLYMMMDFQANGQGNVNNQTRVITGVTSLPASGTWYLNLHLGNSNNILANGAPALPFRPLLCANS